jgi:hypothetical protein
MPQDHGRNRWVGSVARMRARLLRAGLSAALVGVLAAASVSVAQAADDGSTDDTAVAKLMEKLGLKAPPDQNPDINYSERSPLVVPPSRDLPPPVAELPPAAGWPKDSAKPQKRVRSKSAPAATATAAPADVGATGSLPGQATQPGQASAPARAPNPTPQQTSWWNPKSWFNHEEYAAFSTEPAREDLTDPPAGYRTPSPDQPYGVGPERKKTEDGYTPTVSRRDLPR